MAKSKKKFKTEVQQLLDLVIHSLYSNREIFLRELISNASDAIDRARFEGLSEKGITEPDGGWRIRVTPDQEAGTLTLSDNGIGMTRDEVEQNIGTIANSGTKAFMSQMQSGDFKDHPELIGQFGVGFYSSFMVADKVTVITRRAGSEHPAVKWQSTGDGTFTLDDAEKDTPGTDIILHIGEDHKEFMDEWKIRQIVKKYSDYVAFPVTMDIHREEKPTDDEGKPVEGAEPVKTTETETLNSMQAIWTRAKKDIKQEEYNEFYKAISHDFTDPAETIHWKAEGALEFNALLYLPSKAPFDLFYNMEPKGIHLYVKRVFIMNDCKDLLPPYLRFVTGVVDSSDLPLNVSREILQEDLLVKKISKNLVSKVLGALKTMKEKRPKDYQAFYRELGKVLKEGLHSDYANKEKLQDLVLYTSSKSDELTALKDYVARMHPDQKEIYYLAGDNHDAVTNSPHLEAFKKKDYEVLFMTDPIDEFVAQSLTEYDGKPLKAIDHGDVNLLNEDEKEEQEKAKEVSQEKYGDLLKALTERLNEEVEEVRLSDRLTDSACCLVAPQHGMNAHMERIMQSMGQELPKSKRILELNPEHPVMETMLGIYKADEKNARLDDYAELLYSQGLITEGSAVKNPLRFTQLVSDLMAAGGK